MEAGRVSPSRPDSVFRRKRCLMPSHGSCCGLWRGRYRGSRGQGDRSDAGRPECWRESGRKVIAKRARGVGRALWASQTEGEDYDEVCGCWDAGRWWWWWW